MEELEFKLEGPIVEGAIPLHIAIDALDKFQGIIDKTYLVAVGLQRMTTKERNYFQIRAKHFKLGSFITNYEFYLSGAQIALPFVSAFGPKWIWEYTKETFQFLKLVCSAINLGNKPTFEFKNNRDFTVNTGDIHQTFNGPVYMIGDMALKNYQNLAHLVQEGKIESISVGSKEHPEIFVDIENRSMFDLPTELQQKPITVECEIFDFNKYKNKGKLKVKGGQAIPSGNYTFSIYGPQDNVNYIYSMLRPLITIECLIEMAITPFAMEKIAHLYVTQIIS